MDEKDAEMCVEVCASFKQASESAKLFARQYHCEVSVAFRPTRDRWEVFITGKSVSLYVNRERLEHERAFNKACEPDPDFEPESEREMLIAEVRSRYAAD